MLDISESHECEQKWFKSLVVALSNLPPFPLPVLQPYSRQIQAVDSRREAETFLNREARRGLMVRTTELTDAPLFKLKLKTS